MVGSCIACTLRQSQSVYLYCYLFVKNLIAKVLNFGIIQVELDGNLVRGCARPMTFGANMFRRRNPTVFFVFALYLNVPDDMSGGCPL